MLLDIHVRVEALHAAAIEGMTEITINTAAGISSRAT
jgi:hypothetical protein